MFIFWGVLHCRTFTTSNSCDSVEITDVTINNSVVITNANVVSCDSAEVNGNWYFVSQIVQDTFTTSNSCDSVEITDVTINNSIVITNANVVSCDSAEVNGNWYFSSQIVQDTFTTVNSCDSVEITDVTINNSNSFTIFAKTCLPSDTGTTTNLFSNVNGCDSILTTITSLFTNYNDTTLIFISSCSVSDVGISTQILTSINGCDSIVITNTSLLNSDSIVINITSCLPLDTGIKTQFYTNSYGCDSSYTVITNLQSKNPLSNPLRDTSMCEEEIEFLYSDEPGSNFNWNEGTFGPYLLPDTSGVYIVQFIQDATGCLVSDTIVVTIENCIAECVIDLPSGFSPGSSIGVNDIYRVITNCEKGFSEFELRIYNRWRTCIYF